jgi:hypothetical protein
MVEEAADGVDELLALTSEGDLFMVIERLLHEPDADRAAAAFGTLAKRLHARKSLSASVAIARAGIQHCLSCAARCGGDEERRSSSRLKAKVMAYNLAVDTWPGWGQEGIVVAASDLDAGFDAAQLNLRLARELRRGPLPESRAHWALGAHFLARRDYGRASQEFSRARELAKAAKSPEDERLNEGYVALVGTIEGEAAAAAELTRIVGEFRNTQTDDSTFYADQLETALAIFRAGAA